MTCERDVTYGDWKHNTSLAGFCQVKRLAPPLTRSKDKPLSVRYRGVGVETQLVEWSNNLVCASRRTLLIKLTE